MGIQQQRKGEHDLPILAKVVKASYIEGKDKLVSESSVQPTSFRTGGHIMWAREEKTAEHALYLKVLTIHFPMK